MKELTNKEFMFRAVGRFSFVPLLERILINNKAETVLEWGPGYSTYMFLTKLKYLKKLVGIESHLYYYELCKDQFEDIRLEMYLKKSFEHEERYFWKGRVGLDDGVIEKDGSLPEDYSKFPLSLNTMFDIIFVDGSDREKCINTALKIIKNNGIIIVHDAERASIWRGVDRSKIDVITNEFNTVIIRKKT